MNIGIRLHDTLPGSFWDRLTCAKKQGFSCVHLAMSKALPRFDMQDAPRRLDDHLAEQVRSALAIKDMECAVLGCYLRLAEPDPGTLERTREIYRAHLRFAKKIGARVVGTETPGMNGVADAGSEEAFARFIENARPVVRWAEEEDVLLAIEPVACHIVSTPERAQRMLEAFGSDHVRIILDAVNLLTRDNYMEADAVIEDAVRRLGDRVSVLHMKDFTVDPDEYMVKACACGTGVMDYDRLLRFAVARDLPMTLENTVPENAEAARRFLKARGEALK